MATDASKDGFGPASAWAQSAELSFRGLFILVFLLAAGWVISNCRQVAPDSRAIVLRFGTVVRQAGPGLLLALPQPFEHVIILPSPDRQIEFKVSAFRPSEGADRFFTRERVNNSTALPPAAVSDDPRQNTGMLLTGDMSVVHFDATIFYQITDANSYVLSSEHVAPALTRLFVASAVAISARRDLDTILVARPELNTSNDTARAGREGLRADLAAEVNRRLADLVSHGAGLGIQVSRVDLVPSIPVEAKSAFDAVLYALQEAETVAASARTEAETTAQKANQDKDRILTDAQAMAQERVTQAKTRTATILALAQGAQGLSADMVSKQLYQEQVGKLLGQAGKVFTTDGAGSARLIVPGGKTTMTTLTDNQDRTADTVLLSGSEQLSLATRLTVSLIAGGCLIVSGAIQVIRPEQHDVAELVAGVAALLVAVPAFRAAWRSLRQPGLHGIVDQLIALALLAAWANGSLVTAALLPLVMTIGHILEERSLLGSQEAIRALSRLTPTKARRLLANRDIEEVNAQALHVGDLVEVRAGDLAPADGIVETGVSSVDIASITGESVPVEVQPGSEVLNGTLNLDGHLVVRITRVGAQTTLGRVVSLLRDAEQAKPPITRLLERYANRYLVLVLLLAAGTWFVSGDTAVMLAILVASCPAALVLAAPATSIAGISVASRHGILVKGAAFLESLATVDSVALDKTGTVTTGQLRLVEARPEPGVALDELVEVAGNLGAASSHPVSRALAPLVGSGERWMLEDIHETRGLGVVARKGDEPVALGRLALFEQLKIPASPPPSHDGPTAGVARGSKFLGWVLLADEPRPHAREAVADLARLGLRRQILITGDRSAAAHRVADVLNITEVYAELLPEQKMRTILDEVASGHRPLVVGDGINDALALKAGAVGIAMGGQGTDVALASADLVLMTNDLRRLGTCIRLSRRCRRTIYANVAIGLIWTLVIVACAVTGVLGALTAALLQNLSSLIIMFNAGRLLKFQELLP